MLAEESVEFKIRSVSSVKALLRNMWGDKL